MSYVVNAAVAAPAPSAEPASAPVENNEESVDLDAEEAELEESEESSEEELSEEQKKAKEKEAKAKELEKKALEKRIKKLKLKVDGKEIEEEIDLDDDERLIRELQMAKMGQKRAQEKSELENEFRKFFQALQEDPLAILAQEFKMNPEDLIESYINKQLEQSQKTPEQLEKERLENELKAIREEREKEKQIARERELERITQQEYERTDALFDQAFSKSDLPRTPYMVKKVADYMIEAVDAGYDVTPEDVIPLVRDEMHKDIQNMFQVLPEEMVEQILGDQVLNKLHKRRIAKAKESQAKVAKPSITDSGKNSKDSENKPKEKVNYKDFFGL